MQHSDQKTGIPACFEPQQKLPRKTIPFPDPHTGPDLLAWGICHPQSGSPSMNTGEPTLVTTPVRTHHKKSQWVQSLLMTPPFSQASSHSSSDFQRANHEIYSIYLFNFPSSITQTEASAKAISLELDGLAGVGFVLLSVPANWHLLFICDACCQDGQKGQCSSLSPPPCLLCLQQLSWSLLFVDLTLLCLLSQGYFLNYCKLLWHLV